MTAKRFKCHLGVVGVHIGVGTDEHELTGDECRDLLNKLSDENVRLKFQLQNTSAQRDEFLEKENEQLKFENNELKCALALDEVVYIIADGKKIDIPPYYEFEQRYDSVMHRREYDEYD